MKPDELNVEEIKAAIASKREADEAAKTNEERIAELSESNAALTKKNEEYAGVVEARVAEDFAKLPENAQKFVSEFAGEDPLSRMSYMSSESFRGMIGDKKPSSQGGLNQGAGSGQPSPLQSDFNKKYAEMNSPGTSARRRAELSKELQGMARQDGSLLSNV